MHQRLFPSWRCRTLPPSRLRQSQEATRPFLLADRRRNLKRFLLKLKKTSACLADIVAIGLLSHRTN